jgi:membrane protein
MLGAIIASLYEHRHVTAGHLPGDEPPPEALPVTGEPPAEPSPAHDPPDAAPDGPPADVPDDAAQPDRSPSS